MADTIPWDGVKERFSASSLVGRNGLPGAGRLGHWCRCRIFRDGRRAGQKDLNQPDQFDDAIERPGRTRTRHTEVPRQAPVSGLLHVQDDTQYACPLPLIEVFWPTMINGRARPYARASGRTPSIPPRYPLCGAHASRSQANPWRREALSGRRAR